MLFLNCGHNAPAPKRTAKQAAYAFGRECGPLMVTCPKGCGLVETVAAPVEPVARGAYVDPWAAPAAIVTLACCHPRSCRACDSQGVPCGRHHVGDAGHERCSGRSA